MSLKVVIGSLKLKLWMWLADLNNNLKCDWLIELPDNKLSDKKLSDNKLSNNKLSDNNLAYELVENRSFETNHNRGNWNFYS